MRRGRELAKVVTGSQALQAAGVVVIWRPFLEQNSSEWWWVTCNSGMSQLPAVWRDMFATFAAAGLHNILWAYASNGPWQNMDGCPGAQGESGLCLYPGSGYVDIVGLDDYRDATGPMPDNFDDNWRAWSALGKVLALTERGPAETDGSSLMYESLLSGAVANRGSDVPPSPISWRGLKPIPSSPIPARRR